MEQQRRLGGLQTHHPHQFGLTPQQPEALLTGAARGRQLAQGGVVEGSQLRPAAQPRGSQYPLLAGEVGGQLPALL